MLNFNIKHTLKVILLVMGVLTLFDACRKETIIVPRSPFTIIFNNEYNLLQARFGAFISGENGKVLAFRWLDGHDTTHLGLPFSDFKHYNCTVIKIIVDFSRQPADTLFELTSYDQVANNTVINLRDLEFNSEADVKFQFTKVVSLDSLVVPEGEVLVMPSPTNNYFGNFKIRHNGDFWLRAKFNGENSWKYLIFSNYVQSTSTYYIDQTLLPEMVNNLPSLKMPFEAHWRSHFGGVIDIDAKKVMPLNENLKEPDDYVPISNSISIYQPGNQVFNAYKANIIGTKKGDNGYTYEINRFYSILPNAVEVPTFTLGPTLINDNRRIGVRSTGDIDAVIISRKISGNPRIVWRAYTPPVADGNISHELPDLPREIQQLSSKLGNYQFDSGTAVRAERYKLLFGFEDLQLTIFDSSDPFWVPKNELLAIERIF